MRLLVVLCIIVLLPIGSISAQLPIAKKGLAGGNPADANLVGASWYYVWNVSTGLLEDPRYIPLIVDGFPKENLPQEYSGWLLVFSEPDGHWDEELTNPEIAANRYKDLLDYYPNASMIVGGTIGGNAQWASEFLSYLEVGEYPDRWHTHYYLWHPAEIEMMVSDIMELYELVNTPIWVTETGSPSADTVALSAAMLWLEETDWIERYAVFTNRIEGTSPWFPEHWNPDMALIEWGTDNLTEMGEMYVNHEVHKVFIPIVQ